MAREIIIPTESARGNYNLNTDRLLLANMTRAFAITLSFVVMLGIVASGGGSPAVAASEPAASTSGEAFTEAYYSNRAVLPQAKSPAGMRNYLSSNQPQMEMQSNVFFGNLMSPGGHPNSFASMIQRQNGLIPQVPGIPLVISTVLVNPGKGWFGGAINGVPELTFPMTITSDPWSARSEEVTVGQVPEFVDMRVVDGQLGQQGAVYEITASVSSEKVGAVGANAEPMTAYIRVKDMTGIAMWGFGPSGFKPQWLNATQRTAVMEQYGGSIKRYLENTNDPMSGQGNYYYSSPLLKVQKFVFYRDGKKVLSGKDGYMFFDQCTQSFSADDEKVLGDNFGWVSFEIPIPAVNGGMVLGRLSQPTVGNLAYAALATRSSPRAQNGALVAYNWGLKDIELKPVAGSEWKSPTSGKTYSMKWRAVLRGQNAAHRGRLTLTAVNRNSEIDYGGRTVYEGLFRYSGVIAGKKVSGTTFAEMQVNGSF